MAYPVVSGLDAAVVGLGGLKLRQRLGRVGEEGGDRLQHRRAVGLEREEVVSAPVQHQLRRLRLGMDGVARDQRAVEGQRRQQRPGGGDLVLAAGHGPLAEADPRIRPERRDDLQRRAARRAVEGAPQRLAVDRQHPRTVGTEVAKERLEGPSEGLRFEQAEDPAERVMAGQAVLQPQEFPQQRLPVAGEFGEIHATLPPADRGHQRDRQDIEQVMAPRIAPARVGHGAEDRVQRGHRKTPAGRPPETPDNPSPTVPFLKCDSPAAGGGGRLRGGGDRRNGALTISQAEAGR